MKRSTLTMASLTRSGGDGDGRVTALEWQLRDVKEQLTVARAEVQRLHADNSSSHAVYEVAIAEKHDLADRLDVVQGAMHELKRQLEAVDAERRRLSAAAAEDIQGIDNRLKERPTSPGTVERPRSSLDIAQIRTERDSAIQRAEALAEEKAKQEERLEVQLQERLAANEQRLQDIYSLVELKDGELEALRSAAQQNDNVIQNIKEDYEKALASSRQEIDKLRTSYNQKRERMLAGHKAALEQLGRQHQPGHTAATDQQVEDLRQELLQAKQDHQADMEEANQDRETALAKRADLQQQIYSLTTTHAAEIQALKLTQMHALEKSAKKESHVDCTAQLKAEHDRKVAEMELSHRTALWAAQDRHKALQETHSLAVDDMERTFETRLAQLEEQHERNQIEDDGRNQNELDEASAAHNEEVSLLREKHARLVHALETDLAKANAAVNDLEQFATEEISRLKIVIARSTKHAEETQVQMNNIREELLETREEVSEMTTAHNTMSGEMAALRTRLDAELTAHAEAERALAALRKERAEEKTQVGESNAEMHGRIMSLRKEKERLVRNNRRSLSSLLDLRSESTANDEVAELTQAKMQLQLAEAEKTEAQKSVVESSDALSEMTRQNAFLAKEVEDLMAQLNATNSTQAHVGVQTDAVEAVATPTREFRRPATRTRTPTRTTTPLPVLPEDYREQKADAETMRALKATPRPANHSHVRRPPSRRHMSSKSDASLQDSLMSTESLDSDDIPYRLSSRHGRMHSDDQLWTPSQTKRHARQLTSVPRTEESIPRVYMTPTVPHSTDQVDTPTSMDMPQPYLTGTRRGPPLPPPERKSSKPLPREPVYQVIPPTPSTHYPPEPKTKITTTRTSEPRAAHTIRAHGLPATRVTPPTPNPSNDPPRKKPNLKHSSSSIFLRSIAV